MAAEAVGIRQERGSAMRFVAGLADRVLDRLVPRVAAAAGTGSLECYRFRCGTGVRCWYSCCRTPDVGGWDCSDCPCDV
ncbi:hypothetical protein Afil01_69110 [Actinorhabdospora filicis]|uniref:Uncharacterized protein n=1 Tax=Actinorhabdospora filicis TaxID=1785913 RepID=A0A9W6SUD3_9ACTN|nr:hypothetical protein Afil01_69110 [Actinorhabdospora filicis]